MKKLTISLIIIIAWLPWIVAAFDKDKPAASTSLRSSNPEILANWSQLQTGINNEHIFSGTSSGTQTGDHTQGSARIFFADGAPSTRIDGDNFLSTDLGSMWVDTNSSPDNQLNILTATTPTWTPVSTEVIATMVAATHTWAGSQTLGAGADLIGSATSDIDFGSGNFTVAGATGNTLVGGTFDIGSTTAVSGILDEDAMGSDSATDLASQQSIKAYVDSLILPSGLSGGNDSDGETAIGVLEVKWGSFTISSNTVEAKTFVGLGVSAFTNNCFQVIATSNNTDVTVGSGIGTSSYTKDGFTATNDTAASRIVHWIAVGR